MSWDIYIQDFPEVASIKDVPASHRPGPIGERDALVTKIKEVIPFAEEQDRDWIFLRNTGVDISVQLHMEDAQQVRYMVAHIHGGEQSAVCIAALLRHLGLRAHDTTTGEIFDGDPLDEGL